MHNAKMTSYINCINKCITASQELQHPEIQWHDIRPLHSISGFDSLLPVVLWALREVCLPSSFALGADISLYFTLFNVSALMGDFHA